MTKYLIITGAVLGTVLVAGVILSLVAPKRIEVTHHTFIKASKAEVFDNLRFMKFFPEWSPFRVEDPMQKYSISGEDGKVGATFHWVGVKEKSKGKQTITQIRGNDFLKLECQITVPFEAKPSFTYTLEEKKDGVELTQSFVNELPVPANIFGLLFGLKEKISATNRLGMDRFKNLTEKQWARQAATF